MLSMTLFNYAGDRRKLNKYITAIDTIDIIAITNDTDILSPEIIIDTRAFNFNYVYIPAWSRYYYVDNIRILGGERIALQCSVDVLMSHKAAIASSQVIADRSSSRNDPYLVDNKVPTVDACKIYTRNMGSSPFNTATYVIQVAGR